MEKGDGSFGIFDTFGQSGVLPDCTYNISQFGIWRLKYPSPNGPRKRRVRVTIRNQLGYEYTLKINLHNPSSTPSF